MTDGGTPGPIGTRDAVTEAAYPEGAPARSVQPPASSPERLGGAVRGGAGDAPGSALAAAEAAAAGAKRTAGAILAAVVKVLEAMGEGQP